MIVEVKMIEDPMMMKAIINSLSVNEAKVMSECIKSSHMIWVGTADQVVACVWGVALPSLMSNKAYIWLWTKDDIVKGHPFIFIRKAQMVIQQLLGEYEVVVGVCEQGKLNSVRWLKLLGAKFNEPENGLMPFEIRKAS